MDTTNIPPVEDCPCPDCASQDDETEIAARTRTKEVVEGELKEVATVRQEFQTVHGI